MPEVYFDKRTLREFQENLKRVDVKTSALMTEALERGAALVVAAARADHPRVSRAEARAHPHPRFYQWTGLTVAGIAAEEPRRTLTGVEVEVVSSEGHSAALEFGTARARAFPFLGPALTGTAQAVFSLLAAAARLAVK